MSETMEQMRAVWAFMEQEVQKCRERYVEKRPCGSAEDLYEERENVPELLIKEELFRDVDKTVRSFLIHALLCELAGRRKDIEQVHVRLIEDLARLQTGRKISLPYKMTAEKCYDGILLDRSGLKTGEKEDAGNEPGVHMRMFEQTAETGAFPKKTYTKWFDYDIIKNSLTVRTRQPEDVLGVNRQGGTQKLKSYFINEKIPAKSRERILLIAEGHQILWVVGYRMSSRYQISEHTKRIIEIKIMEDKKHGRDN